MTPSPDPSATREEWTGAEAGCRRRPLTEGWQAARTMPDRTPQTDELAALDWLPARVPGTAAGALRDAGLWRAGDGYDFDSEDWWFRTSFDGGGAPAPGEEVTLTLDGIATVAEVFLNGELVLESDSMFAAHRIDVTGRLLERNELVIRCRALGPLLRARRRPRARWRTRLVGEGNLRFFRTMLLGRAPGFAPGPAAVGPWRAVSIERRRALVVEELLLRSRLEGEDGVLSVQARLRPLDGAAPSAVEVELDGPSGAHSAPLALAAQPGGVWRGELRVPAVASWWPHTHGEPALHHVRLVARLAAGRLAIEAGRVGFRALAFGASAGHDIERDGLDLHVNGVRVFARGAVWTPIDAVGLAPGEAQLGEQLERVRAAGMNMLRIPGTSCYETSAFHDLCDELGIMVWQDLMFANLDYPFAEERFHAAVTSEIGAVLDSLAGRPSLTVLCGNSEIEQQVAMLGLSPELGRGEIFGELLPRLIEQRGIDAAYVPSAPCGGDLPFRPDRGIANYYGVGGYRRPLSDARLAGVRFAAECLAFSNVPDEEAIEALLPEAPLSLVGSHPAWKAGIPRDVGSDWDFEDVRDHYLQLLFAVDPVDLRRIDRDRYLELSRQVSGEVMAEVFGEWRRRGSPCGGGLVLWLRDLLPGAGWGLIDHRGTPKLAYRHLRRALAPVAVWTVEEGLNGVVAHVANDRPTSLSATLRVALYRDGELCVGEAATPVELEAHSQGEWNIEALLGHFLDAAWAYRFGAPAQDAIVVSLYDGEYDQPSRRLISQAFRFPAERPLRQEPPEQLGLNARLSELPGGRTQLSVSSTRLAYGVRVHVPGFEPEDDGFSIEPGGERVVELTPEDAVATPGAARVGAVNMRGTIAALSAGSER